MEKAIPHELMDVSRVKMRDTKWYCFYWRKYERLPCS